MQVFTEPITVSAIWSAVLDSDLDFLLPKDDKDLDFSGDLVLLADLDPRTRDRLGDSGSLIDVLQSLSSNPGAEDQMITGGYLSKHCDVSWIAH